MRLSETHTAPTLPGQRNDRLLLAMNLQTQKIRLLRKALRLMLPEYEASAGMLPPEARSEVTDNVKEIRKLLRQTTPRKK